ncbi:MAG: hypothetical protein ACR5K9_02950 [Wolbachia sp.]
MSSTCTLAPLAAFAATPLGIGILATVAVALIGLAIYAIMRNNKISELKAPKIVNEKGQLVLLLTRDVLDEVKENNQHKDEKGQLIANEYCLYFNLEGKSYRVIVGDNATDELGNTLLLNINSLEVKNDEGKYVPISDKSKQLEELDLNKNDAKEFNTYLGSVVVEQAGQSQGQKK